MINHIIINEKEDCVGCGNCALVCPKTAIKMVADYEGFFYPEINDNLCINCGRCVMACPLTRKRK